MTNSMVAITALPTTLLLLRLPFCIDQTGEFQGLPLTSLWITHASHSRVKYRWKTIATTCLYTGLEALSSRCQAGEAHVRQHSARHEQESMFTNDIYACTTA